MSDALSNPVGKTFLHIKEGLFHKKADAMTDGAVNVPTANGEARYYLQFKQFVGTVTSFSTKEEELNGEKFTKIVLGCLGIDGKNYQIEFPMGSGYGRAFFQQIFNADLTKPIALQPVYQVDGAKKNAGLFISQNDKNVGFSYTKERPGDAPAIVPVNDADGNQVVVKGRPLYDTRKRDKFFLDKLNELNATLMTPAAAAVTSPSSDDNPFETDDQQSGDDLPF